MIYSLRSFSYGIKYFEVAREPATGSYYNRLENRQPVRIGYN